MVAVPGGSERHQTALVPAPLVECPEPDGHDVVVAASSAPAPRRRPVTPRPRRAPGPGAMRRPGAALPQLGGDFLSAALALLCREEPLTRAEIGDHADVVAEVADALAAVADRLAHDLDDGSGTEPVAAVSELARARDALQVGSVQARRSAAALWAHHIETLRAQVEAARTGSAM